MNPAALLIVVAASALLLFSRFASASSIEAAPGDVLTPWRADALIDLGENIVNVITETPAQVPFDQAAGNVAAFLAVLRNAEGTADAPNPYAVCYGYRHTIGDFSNHPAVTGEWNGERLSDTMCANAGFGPGCVSTAAGAYQIIRPTWRKLGLGDFSPANQDAAAVMLIQSRGALEDVKAGRFAAAVNKCRNEWASLPGNYAKQGQRSLETLAGWYQSNGGLIA